MCKNYPVKLTTFVIIFTTIFYIQIIFSQGNDECLNCHSDKTLTMEKSGKSISLWVDSEKFSKSVHSVLECVDCHTGFDANDIPHAKSIKPVKCLNCHDGERINNYTQSIHAKVKGGAKCTNCHGTHDIISVQDMQKPENRVKEAEVCGNCHREIVSRYLESDHGRALASGVKGAPFCIDCHGEHTIKSVKSKDSEVRRENEAEVCLKCHLDNPEVRSIVSPTATFISGYTESVHGNALSSGKLNAATCSDCHGSHEMKKGSNPASKVFKTRIDETCGKCHQKEREVYLSSEHGRALHNGVLSSPTCTDCHGEHKILPHDDPKSPVSPVNVSGQVCKPCHESVKLSEKYGIAGNRFDTFSDSYHGLASKAGDVTVANCASCHGYHDIKKSTDSTSRIHKSNLAKTCGNCHPGANENFAKGAVHIKAQSKEEPILYFLSTAYITLIITIVGGMFFHNVIDFIKKAKRQLMIRRGLIPHHQVSHRLYLRMTVSERIQHFSLMVSFIVLVVTGFMLRFPEAWWVEPIKNISPVIFEIRGLLHRIAAVVMIAASLYHLYYILFVPRGKQLIKDLLPVKKDIADAIGVLKYNLGISSVKPKFDRFSYIEKSEYWALIWGTAVMVITGFILWFDDTFMGLLTKLGWDISRTIHYYEAWLAALSILVWHIYFVIFNPDVYPMNLAWIKGTLTETEMEEEHPLELERIKREEKRILEEEKIKISEQ